MKRLISLVLVLMLTVSCLMFPAEAALTPRKEVKRAISIVFDNSGSMYIGSEDTKKAWCRATYAMEAFATMMNSNDIMDIYPMWDITVNGEKYTMDNPLRITQKTASQIRNIYSPEPWGTPIEAITTAYEGLMEQSADEKWLIVLTDGANFDRSNVTLSNTVSALEQELTKCVQNVNVMYLGIGSQSAHPKKVQGNYYFESRVTKNSGEVLSALTDMCNTIFGRDVLPGSGDTLEFGVSMSKLILFIQGTDISNVKLGSLNPISTSDMKYATAGGGGQAAGKFLVDDTLQGVLAIYSGVDAGSYDLSYTGSADSVVCYYEPDVDIYAELLDSEGNKVDPNAENTAGDYQIRYCMVDKYGKEVPEDVCRELLRNTQYEITYTINDQPTTVNPTQAGTIPVTVGANEVLKGHFKVTYLDGYTIERDGIDLGWPELGLKFGPPPAGHLEIGIRGDTTDHKLSKLTESGIYRLSFTYEGQPLTAEQLDSMENLKGEMEGGNATCSIGRDADGYYAQMQYGGSPVDTQCGTYTLDVSGVYRNQDGLLSNTAHAKLELTVTDDSRALAMTVTADQEYYRISEIAQGEPITVKLNYSGADLTQEELDGLTFTADAPGLPLVIEKDYAASAYVIRLDPAGSFETGEYEIDIHVTGVNEVGRAQDLQDQVDVELGNWPMWARILVPILIFLLLLLLFLYFRSRKRLPKRAELKVLDFVVDGDQVPGNGKLVFNGAGKKTGSIRITSPNAPVPGAQQSMMLEVEAISPRSEKSARRKAMVKNAKVGNTMAVTSWSLKSMTYVPDPEKPGSFVYSITGAPGFKSVSISNNTELMIEADSDMASVYFKAKIVFK